MADKPKIVDIDFSPKAAIFEGTELDKWGFPTSNQRNVKQLIENLSLYPTQYVKDDSVAFNFTNKANWFGTPDWLYMLAAYTLGTHGRTLIFPADALCEEIVFAPEALYTVKTYD